VQRGETTSPPCMGSHRSASCQNRGAANEQMIASLLNQAVERAEWLSFISEPSLSMTLKY
jgi:hypothetical protein